MSKIREKINITEELGAQIRKEWDNQRNRWYFSITDIISILTDTVDSRNYWKVLKNRLKNSHKQLVTDFNQLKMTASDGKKYMVDVADGDTIIKLLEIIAPQHVPPFRNWFVHLEIKSNLENESNTGSGGLSFHESDLSKKISTVLELLVDVFEDKEKIILKTFVAGVYVKSLLISVNMNAVFIKGSRKSEYSNVDEYFKQELSWGSFYREINLDTFIDVDKAEATEYHGLITITLHKIDLQKERFIKAESVRD